MAPEALATFDLAPASERADITERVIVSPCSGRFRPLPPEVFTSEGEWVEDGQPVAEIISGTEVQTVHSNCRGWMMGMLALDGQPVRSGEALFWVRPS